jgi:multidrug efflux pump subunit AcrB
VLFKAHEPGHKAQRSWIARLVSAGFARFNVGFEWLSTSYGRLTRRLVQVTGAVLLVYAGLIGVAAFQFARAPTGFIPEQDH